MQRTVTVKSGENCLVLALAGEKGCRGDEGSPVPGAGGVPLLGAA
jgi:hypothetical protein